LSGDPVINRAYRDGLDLHLVMAEEMKSRMSDAKLKQLKLDLSSRMAEEHRNDEAIERALIKHLRQGAKAINFGLIFKGGPKGLQVYARETYGVEFTLQEAKEFHSLFHEKYSELSLWQDLIIKHSVKTCEVETEYSGLVRHFEDKDYFQKKNPQQSDPYTICVNHPVQGTAAEILGLAIQYIDKNSSINEIRIACHVYDEILLICKEEVKQKAAQLLYDAFAYGYKTIWPDCSLNDICEVSWGETWADTSNPNNILTITEEI